jgi:hypothetical protein
MLIPSVSGDIRKPGLSWRIALPGSGFHHHAECRHKKSVRCIHSFLPSNLIGYKCNNSCSNTTHMMPKARLAREAQFGSVKQRNPLSKLKHSSPVAGSLQQCSVRFFATAFLLMHVQGNQIAPVCLEEKRRCSRAEQRTQLAREVRIN